MPVPQHALLWNSLEITKLVIQLLAPVAVAALGFYVTRIVKRMEHFQWRNQRLVEKRISIYDTLAPDLNDLLCFFTYVGAWKELTPVEVLSLKRSVDKKIYLAAPMFSPMFLVASNAFMKTCYATFQGWGGTRRNKYPQAPHTATTKNIMPPAFNSC